jgi:molybdenum cofactor synthesis domain-containing protein
VSGTPSSHFADATLSSASEAPPTAAVLLIGDELLSGKIRDENAWFLARVLRRRGIRLVEIRTVGDEVAGIGTALLELCDRASIVFTSGGVGPTHDDRTLEAIAAATGRPLVRHPQMEAELRAHYGARASEAALSMADVPSGTRLCAGPGWPVMSLEVTGARGPARIYILPGVPGLLRSKIEKLEELEGELPRAPGWHLTELYTALDESRLAPHLDAVVARHPGVDIGSYPRWTRADDGRITYHVRVTFEGPVAAASEVDTAREELAAALPEDQILAEPPPGA